MEGYAMRLAVGLLLLAAAQAFSVAGGRLQACARVKATRHNLVTARGLFPSLGGRLAALKMVSTDPMPKLDAMATGGMFTNSSPETKRVVPTNMAGKTKFKIVYVVLESQYQSSLTKACNSINSGNEGVAVEAVGYLLEELRNPAVFEQFKQDVGDANIFIGSLIFIQELADKVRALYYSFYLSGASPCLLPYFPPSSSTTTGRRGSDP